MVYAQGGPGIFRGPHNIWHLYMGWQLGMCSAHLEEDHDFFTLLITNNCPKSAKKLNFLHVLDVLTLHVFQVQLSYLSYLYHILYLNCANFL